MMNGEAHSKDYNQPSRDCHGNIIVKIGDEFRWTTIIGEHHEGKIVQMDCNVATVECLNGQKKVVEL